VATVQKKGKELIALAAVGKGKPRTLENNLMRSNNTKSKKRNTNRMQNPFFLNQQNYIKSMKVTVIPTSFDCKKKN
jgi:hypothetical protein